MVQESVASLSELEERAHSAMSDQEESKIENGVTSIKGFDEALLNSGSASDIQAAVEAVGTEAEHGIAPGERLRPKTLSAGLQPGLRIGMP